jgi:hypothetical protein
MLAASECAGPDAISLPEGLKSKRKRRSMNRPLPSQPALTGRTKSILLENIQLVKGPRDNDFLYHKKLPPQIRVAKQTPVSSEDVPREMTEDERSWYSSPWR